MKSVRSDESGKSLEYRRFTTAEPERIASDSGTEKSV